MANAIHPRTGKILLLGSVECDPRGYGPGIPHYLAPDTQEKSIAALKLL